MAALRTRVEARHRVNRPFDFKLTAEDGLTDFMRDQFSCWTADKNGDDSVLCRYGFELGPADVHVLEEPSNITLTPSGVGIRRDQVQLFLPRERFAPVIISMLTSRITPLAGPMDGVRLVEGLGLLSDLFAWIGAYERWVLDSIGFEYRGQMLEAPADLIDKRPERWWSLARRVKRALRQTPRPVGKAHTPRVTLVLN